jgi:2-phospho-L-lactate guanylyltransferase
MTSVQVVVGIPVKPFAAAKRRLSAVLPPHARRRLGEELASRAARTAAAAGGVPLILSADDEVTEWALAQDIDVLLDEGSSLDEAAAAAVRWARTRGAAWIVCHADLPLLAPAELRRAVDLVAGGAVALAPSSSGGTPMLGSTRDRFPFAYGEGSFHRHLAAAGPDAIICRSLGFSLDLDEPSDLEAVVSHRRGRWLAEIVAT